MSGEYYDGTKILSMSDLYGNKPELYLISTNRTGGKTTFFGRYFVNRFIKHGEKFLLLYRYAYEISDVAAKFFTDIQGLFFKGYVMTEKPFCKGCFTELFLNGDSCGYAVPINGAKNVKKYSHYFSDVKRILFDEFEDETGQYCTDEVNKVVSIHTSVARGNGQHVRYVPMFMLGNATTLLNPYYIELGISDRLSSETRFLKGDGYILESGLIEAARDAQLESGFNKAFKNNKYVKHSAENIYLLDNYSFVEQPQGKNRYVCTLRNEGVDYGIREYPEIGIIHCSRKDDKSCPVKIVCDTKDHDVNYIMLRNNEGFIRQLRFYFQKGCFRFADLRCKSAVLNALAFRTGK